MVLATLLAHGSPPMGRHSFAIPVPASMRTSRFLLNVNGRPANFLHAAANYYDVNLIIAGSTRITITAPTNDYWAHGVEIQPWRENLRPVRNGATITFMLDHPAKLAISRPGDNKGGAEMLFIFANAPGQNVPTAATRGVRYFGPGIHRGSIDAHTGDRIYLAPGAIILGALNLWDVEDVKVSGLGTILYDGPQNPNDDEGWRNQKDWHGIVMHNARHVKISDITCIVRSRTWMVQMRDSRFIVFDNIKLIGGSPSNANQDGMDWLGGGDTVVRNSFIRAADDIFALQGNWDGYDPALMAMPGHDVNNILIEDSVLSTSISNVVRVGWPTKTFNTDHFEMRNIDVIEMGIGGCGIPFALLELWGDPDAHGSHSDYRFDDIRLENWYSFLQLQQKTPLVHDVVFNNIWSPEQPPSVGSSIIGNVQDVRLTNIKLGDRVATSSAELDIRVRDGAAQPSVSPARASPVASFVYNIDRDTTAWHVTLDASAAAATEGKLVAYDWFFGDGTTGHGSTVQHTFADEEGTLLDGSGKFRVMLRVTDDQGRSDWSAKPIIVKSKLLPAVVKQGIAPQLQFWAFTGSFADTADLATASPEQTGLVRAFVTSVRPSDDHYAIVYDGFIDMPLDGGYEFTALSRDGSRVMIDGQEILHNAPSWPQVCGSVGNAVQQSSGTVGLMQGRHAVHVEMSQIAGDEAFRLLWQGPGIGLSLIPEQVLSH
jgi:hypothetical protein